MSIFKKPSYRRHSGGPRLQTKTKISGNKQTDRQTNIQTDIPTMRFISIPGDPRTCDELVF